MSETTYGPELPPGTFTRLPSRKLALPVARDALGSGQCPIYMNTECHRCGAAKPTGTFGVWCVACDALPMCDECGDAVIDCDAANRPDPWSGKRYGRIRSCDYGCVGCLERHEDTDAECYAESMASADYERRAYGEPDSYEW